MSLAFVQAFAGQDEPSTDRLSHEIWGIAWTSTDSVVSISADGSINQWDTSGQLTLSPPKHTLALVSLSVSPDGRHALYNSLEGLTCLLDLSSGQQLAKSESYVRASPDAEASWSVSLDPKGKTYASTGASCNVTLHSADPENFGERLSTLQSGRNKFGICCKHSPDGSKIALSTGQGQIDIFDVSSAALSSTNTAHAMTARSLAWSPDSQLLLSASEDKRLVLQDIRAGHSSTVASLAGHSSWVLSADISPDGRFALSGSADHTIKVWDLRARAAVCTIQDAGAVWGVAWRPSLSAGDSMAGSFVSGGDDGIVKGWRAAGSAG